MTCQITSNNIDGRPMHAADVVVPSAVVVAGAGCTVPELSLFTSGAPQFSTDSSL